MPKRKPKTDEAFLEHVKRHAPGAAETHVDFDKVVTHVLRATPDRIGLRPSRIRKKKPKR